MRAMLDAILSGSNSLLSMKLFDQAFVYVAIFRRVLVREGQVDQSLHGIHTCHVVRVGRIHVCPCSYCARPSVTGLDGLCVLAPKLGCSMGTSFDICSTPPKKLIADA